MMNPRIILEILLAFALASTVTFTLRVTGTCASEQRSIATFTARNAYFADSSIMHGNKTDFYDARGFYQGSATRQSTSTSHPFTGK
jgi:hypothetical protein